MTTLKQQNDPHFDSTQSTLVRIWDDLQRWQTDFCFAHELGAYYGSQNWLQAQDVLDIGTGNGYYLRKIVDRFPDKRYTGIDPVLHFVETARRENLDTPVDFQHSSLTDWKGQFDFVIMRLVLQHLPNVQSVLEHVADLTRPGGSVLIVDAADQCRFFYPPLPAFVEFFQAFRSHEASKGRNRDVATEIDKCLAVSPRWKCGSRYQVLIPSSIPGTMELFRKTYARVVDMLETAGEMQYNFATVRDAWNSWCEDRLAFTQVGLTLIRLDRR